MPAAVRHDDPRLYRDTVTGRTTLSAAAGSKLGRFLEDLSDVWEEPKILSVNMRLPAMHFTDIDLATQMEANLKRDLWEAVIARSLMPIAAPIAAWWAIPAISEAPPSGAAETESVPPQRREFSVEPGTALPTGTVACCVATMFVVPLPRPIAP